MASHWRVTSRHGGWCPQPLCQCWSAAGSLLRLLLLSTLALGTLPQFGTEGMLRLLSPYPDSCASADCTVVAGMGIFRAFSVPPSIHMHWEVHEHTHPWRSAVQLRGGCSSHVARKSLPLEHTHPKISPAVSSAAASHGQHGWARVCPWLSPS